VRDFLEVGKKENIDKEFADQVLKKLDVDNLGLDKMDFMYLNFLVNNYQDSAVGIKTIASAISEKEDSIEEIIEPYLIKIGFIERTPRGRRLTQIYTLYQKLLLKLFYKMESAEKPKFSDGECYTNGVQFPGVCRSSKNKRAGLYTFNQYTNHKTVKGLFDIVGHYKRPVAASMMPGGGHYAMLYVLDADTALFIESFSGDGMVKDAFDKLKKDSKKLYYSATPLQKDLNSCGPITTEIAMCLQGKYYLEPRKLKSILEKNSTKDTQNGFYRIDIEKTGIIDKATIKKCRESNTPTLRDEHEQLWEDINSHPLMIQSHIAFHGKKASEIDHEVLSKVELIDHPSNNNSGKILKTGYLAYDPELNRISSPCSDKNCDKLHTISYQFFSDEPITKEIERADKIAQENTKENIEPKEELEDLNDNTRDINEESLQHNNNEANNQFSNENLSIQKSLKQFVIPESLLVLSLLFFASVNLAKENPKLQIASLALACVMLAVSVGVFIYASLDRAQNKNAEAEVSSKIYDPSLEQQNSIDNEIG